MEALAGATWARVEGDSDQAMSASGGSLLSASQAMIEELAHQRPATDAKGLHGDAQLAGDSNGQVDSARALADLVELWTSKRWALETLHLTEEAAVMRKKISGSAIVEPPRIGCAQGEQTQSVSSSLSAVALEQAACFEQLAALISSGEDLPATATKFSSELGSTAGPTGPSRRRLPTPPAALETVAQEAKPRASPSPHKPRGSYIHTGGQVYWLNYDEPMDLQRLPGANLNHSSNSSARDSSAARATAVPSTASSSSSSAGPRRMLQSDSFAYPCAWGSRNGPSQSAPEDISDDEAPPSPSPEEPLLPETPAMAVREPAPVRPARPEVVPKLWDSTDPKQSRPEQRLARASSAIWQRPLQMEEVSTPRLFSSRGGSVTSSSGTKPASILSARIPRSRAGSACTLRSPDGGGTPRWQPTPSWGGPSSCVPAGSPLGAGAAAGQRPPPLVRRQLSAPRLTSGPHTSSRDSFTPRGHLEAPQARTLHGQRAHQLAQPPFSHSKPKQQPRSSSTGQPPPQMRQSATLRAAENYSGRAAVTPQSWVAGGPAAQRSPFAFMSSTSTSYVSPSPRRSPSVLFPSYPPSGDLGRAASPHPLRQTLTQGLQ